jgi:phosphoglycolate phosphatase
VTDLERAAMQMELPVLDDERYRGIIGLSLNEAVQTLYPQLNDEQVHAYREAYRDHHLDLEQEPSRPYPGVTDGLKSLRQSGLKIAVATGKRRAGLSRSLKANDYHSFFDASRTADDAHSKPHPMMLDQLLEEFQVPAEEALMVGDSSFDLVMAAHAGMDSVAVTYGAQSESKLKQHEPVFVADSFDELMDWLGEH